MEGISLVVAYIGFGMCLGVGACWMDRHNARRLRPWVIGLVCLAWPLVVGIGILHVCLTIIGGIVKLAGGAYREEVRAFCRPGERCRKCGMGPLIYSCRAIGDGLCHQCGHEAAVELREQNRKLASKAGVTA